MPKITKSKYYLDLNSTNNKESFLYDDEGNQIYFSKEEVKSMMRHRVERSHQAFFRRYNVKDLQELDELFGVATKIKYGDPNTEKMD